MRKFFKNHSYVSLQILSVLSITIMSLITIIIMNGYKNSSGENLETLGKLIIIVPSIEIIFIFIMCLLISKFNLIHSFGMFIKTPLVWLSTAWLISRVFY